MKAEIKAGASIDFLTKDEMAEVLKGWTTELHRGVKFRLFSGIAVVAAGAFAISIDAPPTSGDMNGLGPDPGFVWAVTRIAVSGSGFTLGTDKYSVYNTRVDPNRLAAPNLLLDKTWDIPQFVLNPGERVAVGGAATGGAGAQVVISGAAAELPIQLAWQLL